MKKEFKFSYEHFQTLENLDENQKKAIDAAIDAKKNAYVPYSEFQVGAALLLEDGTIIKGCNQENKSYPVGICAERTALFTYGTLSSPSPIKILGIVGDGDLLQSNEIFSPCGACRQAMAEYTDRQGVAFQIVIRNNNGTVNIFEGIHQILPFIFGNK